MSGSKRHARAVGRNSECAAVVALLAAGVALLTPSAFAATAQQKAACTPDVWRLCSSEVPNVSKIVACLNRNHGKLSSACRVVMDGGSPSKTAGR